MKVAVIVPNWNGKAYLGKALDSLLAQDLKPEVLVVDNGSVDGSVEHIKQNYPGVQLIELDKNHGFAGGVNSGIKMAIENDVDYVALLNNDATADKLWLQQLVRRVEANPKIGIVACKLMRTDKKHIDSTGDVYSVWGVPFPRGRNQMDTAQYNHSQEVFSASGGASLYRVKMFEQIGLFDERFFAYLEDVDISFRAQLAGWRVAYEPSALAYHHIGATSSKLGSFSRYHFTKNFFMLYVKNMPGVLFWKYLPLFLLQSARFAVSNTLRGEGLAYFQALSRAIINSPGVLKDRWKIQKTRKVTTNYIDSMLYKHRPPKIPTL